MDGAERGNLLQRADRGRCGALTGGAAAGALVQEGVLGARSAIDGAAGSAAAAGAPGAVGAIGDVCASWSGSLGALGDAIGQLHANLGAAAAAYELTDTSAIDP